MWDKGKKNGTLDKTLSEQEELLLMKFYDGECSIFESRAAERLLSNNIHARGVFEGFGQLGSDFESWASVMSLDEKDVVDGSMVDEVLAGIDWSSSLGEDAGLPLVNGAGDTRELLDCGEQSSLRGSYSERKSVSSALSPQSISVSARGGAHQRAEGLFSSCLRCCRSAKEGLWGVFKSEDPHSSGEGHFQLWFGRLGWSLSGAMAGVALLLVLMTSEKTRLQSPVPPTVQTGGNLVSAAFSNNTSVESSFAHNGVIALDESLEALNGELVEAKRSEGKLMPEVQVVDEEQEVKTDLVASGKSISYANSVVVKYLNSDQTVNVVPDDSNRSTLIWVKGE